MKYDDGQIHIGWQTVEFWVAARGTEPRLLVPSARVCPLVRWNVGVTDTSCVFHEQAGRYTSQCAQCGRPTAKKDRKKCKSCGGREFVACEQPVAQEEEGAKKKGWFSSFWGS